MADLGRTERVIGCATPEARPARRSRYVVSSLCLSGASALWLVAAFSGVSLPFYAYKQHQVGGAASAVALVLALAAYCGPNRRRGMTHVALIVAVLVCLAYFLVVPV